MQLKVPWCNIFTLTVQFSHGKLNQGLILSLCPNALKFQYHSFTSFCYGGKKIVFAYVRMENRHGFNPTS